MNRQQKILYVITKSNFGGAQKYVYELAVAAQQAGADVTVALGGSGSAAAAPGLLYEKLQAAQIETVVVKSFMRNVSLLRDLYAFFELLKIIREHQPDVVHVTSSKAGALGGLAGRIAGSKRIIFTSHGLTMDETWRPRWQRILITIATWCTMMCAHVSIMISQTTYTRARAMPFLQNKVALVYNGITDRSYLPRATARSLLAPHLPQEGVWIGGIGELHPNKNWSALIEALTCIPSPPPVVIIGEGEERSSLTRIIEETNLGGSVYLKGFVDQAADYLTAFDIFILPSKKEGLPYVLLEAGLARCAVIGSDIPGCQDIITDGKNGRLVTISASSLSMCIQELLANEHERSRLGNALRDDIAQRFTMPKMLAETFSLYRCSPCLQNK